jgi:hypothetical protein
MTAKVIHINTLECRVHPNILEASLCLQETAATMLQACQLLE